VNAQCIVPGNKIASPRVKTMECIVQSRSDESEFPGREDFQKNG